MKLRLLYIFIFLISLINCVGQLGYEEKINGVNFVSPKLKEKLNGIDSIGAMNANWIALCPFALLTETNAKIIYNTSSNWWGDTKKGLIEGINKARENKLKILIKPHFWVIDKGWAGDFDVSGKQKTEWENNYNRFMLYLARISDSLNIEMLCIGTELKHYSIKHPEFFISLINEIKKVYKGKLTYAANWDEFDRVKFWDKLDFISVDAYFPLSDKKTPEIKDLELTWKKVCNDLKKISLKFGKKIIFTEYGYKSINYAADKQWEFENTPVTEDVNLTAQINSYVALYNSVWKVDYFAGGFLWKWYNKPISNNYNSDYSPQGKAVLGIIKKQYSKKL